MSKPTSNQISVRLSPAQVAEVDRLASVSGMNRPRVLREALDLRISTEGQARLLRDAVRTAADDAGKKIREDVNAATEQMLEIVRATDQAHREILNDFLAGLAGDSSSSTSTKSSAPLKPRD